MPIAAPELQAFANGFPLAIMYWALAFGLLVIGILLHASLSPYRELDQTRKGNAAAAVSLGGAMIALALPLAAAVMASASLVEAALWGVAALSVQLLLGRLADFALRGLPERVGNGDVAAAWVLVSAKASIAVILAAAVSA